jgi:DNA-binding NtrC family response regulator
MDAPILIVEDDPMQRQMLSTLLRRQLGFNAQAAENGREALALLDSEQGKAVKLVIMDLDMPVMGGMETLEIMNQKYPSLPVIMLTGSKSVQDAVEALKRGAVDFLTKPYEGARIALTIKNALKMSILSKEVSRLKGEKSGRFSFENLIGHGDGLAAVVQMGRKAAASDIPVLIAGETGTGKEAFSSAIHGESRRAGKPFVAVNCGAIPAQLVESTLFGHEKGAFTGAIDKALGKFREAEGGTIFLDEVGELPRNTQVKLLRVLQQKEVEPVGAARLVPIDVRIVSATNRDLEAEVTAGRFREDLFFRINVLPIELPSLRERKGDIPALAHHFIERFCVNEGGIPKEISSATHQRMLAYDWPGNVRQLENTINRAMVMSDGGALDVHDLVGDGMAVSEGAVVAEQDIRIVSSDGAFKTMDVMEQEAMRMALAHFGGNVTQASKALGMAKSTFYRKYGGG